MTHTHTNGGLSYRVGEFKNGMYKVDVLNEGGCPVAYSEFHVLESKDKTRMADLGNNTVLSDDGAVVSKDNMRAYVMLACMSLIRTVYDAHRVVAVGDEAEFDVTQWHDEKVEAKKIETKEPTRRSALQSLR